MTVFEHLHMPSLGGATEWLNSEPLGPAELRGHVVLVNFWTLTCINWLRTEPYVRTWSQVYKSKGVVVIGVHTPEFSFEHEIDRVRQATKERAIDYPVAVDNDYAIWSAFDNHYWPALYFVDADGIVRDHHFGEGRYEQSERVIQRLLGVERELVSVEGLGVEAEADWDHLRTPETYLGYGRSDHFASPAGPVLDERRAYELPERVRVNHWAREPACLVPRPPPDPGYRVDATLGEPLDVAHEQEEIQMNKLMALGVCAGALVLGLGAALVSAALGSPLPYRAWARRARQACFPWTTAEARRP